MSAGAAASAAAAGRCSCAILALFALLEQLVLCLLFPRPDNEYLVGMEREALRPAQHDPPHPEALALDQIDDREAGYDGPAGMLKWV